MTRTRLSRRTILRGAGVSLALPVLDAMLNDHGLLHGSARAAAFPTRLIVWSFGNGTRMNHWNPSIGDARLTAAVLTKTLAPLAPKPGKPDILPYLTWVTGLDHKQTVLAGAHDGVFIASGGPNVKTNLSAFPLPGGPSIDQVAADKLGDTRLRSLSITNDNPKDIINWVVTSWTATGRPIYPYADPRTIFDKMFGAGPAVSPAQQAAVALRKSILDYVAEEGRQLAATVGAADRARIDEHLNAVREVEKQLAGGAVTCANVKAPDFGAAPDFIARGRLLMSLLVISLRCDITRFGTFVYQNSDGQTKWPNVTWKDHDASHNAPDDVVVTITQNKIAELLFLLEAMQAVPEGSGTLLDHSLVLCSSEIGQGNAHRTNDLPVLIAGRGGGLAGGRHLKRSGANYNDMLCSLLNYAGVPTTKFGVQGTGPLAGL